MLGVLVLVPGVFAGEFGVISGWVVPSVGVPEVAPGVVLVVPGA